MGVIGHLVAKVVMTARVWTAAFLLGSFAGLLFASGFRLLNTRRTPLVASARVLLSLLVAVSLASYVILARPFLVLAPASLLVAILGALVFGGLSLMRAVRREDVGDGAGPLLLHAAILSVLAILAGGTLLLSGFLSLTEDHPVLVVDVSGETSSQVVRWAPPDEAPRSETLVAHHVLFRRPEGEVVADAWIYGDEVAVKGRVLRLSPVLNAAGVPNLFELTFAHNGYTTAERHNTMPHQAIPLPHLGPLAVHPLLRPLQLRLLTAWQTRSDPLGTWGVRASTVESTYFPLEDRDGKALAGTYTLVVTPGGLTAS